MSGTGSGSSSARALREAIDQQSTVFQQHLEQQQQLMAAVQAQLQAMQTSIEDVGLRASQARDHAQIAATDARSAVDQVQSLAECSMVMEAEPTPPPPQQFEPEPSLPVPPDQPVQQPQQPAVTAEEEPEIMSFGLPRSLKLERPPMFEGAMDGDTISSFVHRLDLLFNLSGLQDNVQRASYAVTCLDKAAYTWFVSQQYRLASLGWPQLKQDLLDTFRPLDYTFQTRQELANCRQTGDVRKYVKAFRWKYTRCQDVSDDEAKFRFIDGLYAEEQRHVRLAKPINFHHAASLAEQIGVTMPRRDGKRQQQYNGPRRNDDRMQLGTQEGQQRGRGQQGKGRRPQNKPSGGQQGGQQGHQGQKQHRFQGECRYCGIWGHMERDCRKKQRSQGQLSGAEQQSGGAGSSGAAGCGASGSAGSEN